MTDFSLDELVAVHRDEKTSRGLVELPEDFYLRAGRYISQLLFEIKRGDSLRQKLLGEELKNVVTMVMEIHLTRVLKGMNKIVNGKLPAPLIDRERYAFSEIRQALEKLHDDLIKPAITGRIALTAPPDLTNSLVLLLVDIPEKIMGADMRGYGPLSKGEITSIPASNAEIMIRHGAARKIAIKA